MDIAKALTILHEEKNKWQDYTLSNSVRNPFLVLLGGILSHRTKDTTTRNVLARFSLQASTPEMLLTLSEDKLVELLYPIGFYRRKAKILRQLAQELLEKHQGRVPDDLEKLLKLPGVGIKTANLVLSIAFKKPAICVDTHVHRIVNRWGYVQTKNPEETEKALREKLPLSYWITINHLLVLFGQNVCLPRRPRCPACPLEKDCPKVGVEL
ncbi:MAG: endonuclease III domain-containing protein [Candidatus Caldatribacteriaceae bacterium]